MPIPIGLDWVRCSIAHNNGQFYIMFAYRDPQPFPEDLAMAIAENYAFQTEFLRAQAASAALIADRSTPRETSSAPIKIDLASLGLLPKPISPTVKRRF